VREHCAWYIFRLQTKRSPAVKVLNSAWLSYSSSCLGIKRVVHFSKKRLLIIYSPPCHPRCPCLSFFSRIEIKVFDENIPGFFSPYNGLQREPNGSRSKIHFQYKLQTVQKGFKRFQTMNKGLIKRNVRSLKQNKTKFKFYKLKCSP